MLNHLSSIMKRTFLRELDSLHHDPYENFTRPFFPIGHESLHKKARRFLLHFKERFSIRGETIYQNRIPLSGPFDLGDQSLWHGIYTGIMAARHSVEKSSDSAMMSQRMMWGLWDQQSEGILCRGINDASYREWDASNDSATGHLFGLYMMSKYGEKADAGDAAKFLVYWAARVLRDNHCLTNPNGKPTTYGRLIQGVKTDPLRSTLAAALYASAAHVSDDNKFINAYKKIVRDYGPLFPHAKTRFYYWDNHNDTHRAAIHLKIIYDCAKEPLALEGMKRLEPIARKSGNLWVAALCWPNIKITQEMTKRSLGEFDVEGKRWDTEKINSDPSVLFSRNGLSWKPKIKRFGKQLVSTQPLPRWAMGSQDFVWQRHPWSVDDWIGRKEPTQEFNGMDFLGAYYLCCLEGLIDPKE